MFFCLKQSQKITVPSETKNLKIICVKETFVSSPSQFSPAPGFGFSSSIWVTRTHRRAIWDKWNTRRMKKKDTTKGGRLSRSYRIQQEDSVRKETRAHSISALNSLKEDVCKFPQRFCLFSSQSCFISPSPEQCWYIPDAQYINTLTELHEGLAQANIYQGIHSAHPGSHCTEYEK